MYYISDTNRQEHSYPTYGRQFPAYKWYKPILVAILFAVFYLLLYVGLFVVTSVVQGIRTGSPDLRELMAQLAMGYDGMDLSDPLQCIYSLGGVALMIPALWLASLIVRDRPFSSYSSSRGGWSSKVFWRVFPVAFLCVSIPIMFMELIIHRQYSNFSIKFTVAGVILLTILGPLQCIAEEYVFRGLLMQTLGSWIKLPIIAVLLQAVIFASEHPYNRIGQVGIFLTGTVFALSAWMGRGLEVPAAFHICNNMTIFYLQGLNMTTISSESDMESLILDVCTGALYLIFIFALSKTTNWFDLVRKDDLAKAREKYARKAALKAEKSGASVPVVEEVSAPSEAEPAESSGTSSAESSTEGYTGKHYKN